MLKKRLLTFLKFLVVIIILACCGLYFAFSYYKTDLIKFVLQKYGFNPEAIEITSVGLRSTEIPVFKITKESEYNLALDGIVLSYSPFKLISGEINDISIKNLSLEIYELINRSKKESSGIEIPILPFNKLSVNNGLVFLKSDDLELKLDLDLKLAYDKYKKRISVESSLKSDNANIFGFNAERTNASLNLEIKKGILVKPGTKVNLSGLKHDKFSLTNLNLDFTQDAVLTPAKGTYPLTIKLNKASLLIDNFAAEKHQISKGSIIFNKSVYKHAPKEPVIRTGLSVQHIDYNYGEYAPQTLSGNFSINNNLKGSLTDENNNLRLKFFFEYNPDYTIKNLVLDFELDKLSDDLPLSSNLKHWPYPFDIVSGQLNGSFSKINYGGSANGKDQLLLSIEEANGKLKNINFKNLSGSFDIEPTNLSFKPSDIWIEELSSGFLLKEVSTKVSSDRGLLVNSKVLKINNASGQIFGGEVKIPKLDYSIASNSTNIFTLWLQKVDLEQIVSILNREDLEVSGTISGSVPMEVSKTKISINNGTLKADAPGGVIKYLPKDPEALKGMLGSSLEFVLKALKNYHYNSLVLTPSYKSDGTLSFLAQLEGNNPDLNNQRPIHVNLNVEQNLPALLKSLQMKSKVEQAIGEKFKKNLVK